MSAERFRIRIPGLVPFLGAGAAAMLYASACFAEAGAGPSAMTLLREPPKLNYAKICVVKPAPQPLAIDWTQWDGAENGVAADQMLSDAGRLAAGDDEVHRDRVLARKMLSYLAAGNSTTAPEAKVRLAMLLLDPKSGTTDAGRAAELLAEATAAQRTGAALAMGKLIREGSLPGMSLADASRYLSIAAGLGDPAAALQLAAIYSRPDAAIPFPGAAAHFATLAAISVQTALVSGNCDIAVEVGEYLVKTYPGEGAALAAGWFEVAAGAGDIRALARLARIYETGEGRERDVLKARDLWDRAATGGLVRALVPAARIRLASGEDLPTATRLLDAAMAHAEPDAYLLAGRFHRGDYSGRADFPAMLKVLEAAVKEPDVSVFAIAMLADAYLKGQGTKIDLKRADELYRLALASHLPDGEALYGRYLIDNGLGLAEGIGHLAKAAENGADAAKFHQAEIAMCMAADNGDRLMKDAAEAGSTPAMRRLARLAADRGDQAGAIEQWRRAAATGDRLAMVELATLSSSRGNLPGIDAADLVKRAAAPGPDMIDGRLALAIAYRSGKFGDNVGEGAPLLTSIAESRRPDVEIEIAKSMLAQPGESNRIEALARLASAAEGGETEAMLLLAQLADPESKANGTGLEWLTRAAEGGEANALAALPAGDPARITRVLAALKERLLCDVPSLAQEARLYRLQGDTMAADQIMVQAEKLAERRPRDIHVLAEAFAAQGAGLADNPAKAALLFEKAATRGYSRSALSLADLLARGRLGKRDGDAIDWYRQAALGGEASGIRELVRYASGQPTQKNAGLALRALQQVAEHDDAAAMQAYGSLLAMLGPDRYGEGMAFLEKAARKGDVQAMKTLARLFAAGLNGLVSAEESTRWTRQAAEKGDPEAMFQYAIALDLGFGVTADRSLAQSWHQKAKQNGFVR